MASGILEHINRGLTERTAPNLDTMLSEILKEVLEFVGISSAFIVRRNDDSELYIEGGIGSFVATGVAEAQFSMLDFDIFSTDQRMYTRDLLILPLSSL